MRKGSSPQMEPTITEKVRVAREQARREAQQPQAGPPEALSAVDPQRHRSGGGGGLGSGANLGEGIEATDAVGDARIVVRDA